MTVSTEKNAILSLAAQERESVCVCVRTFREMESFKTVLLSTHR